MTLINRYHPLTGGKAVIRDINTYPETPQGEAALLAAVNNGTLPTLADVPLGARIGTIPAPINESRADFSGVPLTKTVAATLNGFVARLAPRLRGNYSPLTPQQAKFSVLLSRLPDVTIHPSRTIIWAGPYFTDVADRPLLAKGFTHIAEATPNYGGLAGPGKKTFNFGDGIFNYAQVYGNQLADSDPRKVWLLECNPTNKYFPDNEAAGKYLGNKLFSICYQADQGIDGMEWMTLDVENLEANPRSPNARDAQQYNALAYMYQGIIDQAISENKIITKPLMYDAGNICFQVLAYLDYMENGYPAYFSTSHLNPLFLGGTPGALLNVNHPLAQIAKTYGAAYGNNSYQRNTYDGQTMFIKNPDNTFLLDSDGNPMWRTDDRRAVIAGQSVPISGNLGIGDANPYHRTNDAQGMTTNTMTRMALLTTNMFFANGGNHLPTNQMQPGWEKLQLMTWNRVDTELGGQYNNQLDGNNNPRWLVADENLFNKRPRNEHEIEFDAAMSYIFARVMRNWMETQPSIGEGVNAPNDLNVAKGGWELISKGYGRAAELNFLHDTTWHLLQPRYFMRRQDTANNPDPLEHFARKPLVVGGLVPNYQGKAYIWLGWRYCVQDEDKQTEMIVWAVNPDNTPATPGYRINFDGRIGGLDYWQIPDAAKNLPPSAWRFQMVADMLGHTQTWTGDYRDATITNHPTPPAVLESFAQPMGTVGAPGGTMVAPLIFGTPVYTPATHRLKVPVSGAVGALTFTIVGLANDLIQPDDGFLLPSNIVGSNADVRAKTPTQALIEINIAIPADGAAPPPPPVSGGTAVKLPSVGVGIYTGSVEARDYGNGPEDRTPYEHFGLNYVPNNDGVPVASVGSGKYIPPFVKLFHDTAVAAGATEKLGGYITMSWGQYKVASQAAFAASGYNAPWVAGNLSAAHGRLLSNLFGYAKTNNMSLGLAVTPGREGGFKEYISDSDQPRTHDGSLVPGDIISPAIRQYSHLLKSPGFSVSNIDTTTCIGKFFSDYKAKLHTLQGNFSDGSLSHIIPGTHGNYELGYPTYQNDPTTTWTDWHPDEIADLQTYLRTIYPGTGGLSALNSAWGTAFGQWTDVTLPYTGDYGDFKGQRGKDCTKFRQIRLGDAVELYARVTWSELPGIPIILQFGQPFGGQSSILGTVDLRYFVRRVKAVADELGITSKCIGIKFNPIPYENHRVRARFIAYTLQQELGYVLMMMEDSYDINDTPSLAFHTAVAMSDNAADTLRYGNSGQAGDNVTVFSVLFGPQRFLGVDSAGNPSDSANSVLSMYQRLFSLSNRNTQPFAFNSNTTKSLTVTFDTMQANTGPNVYPWFPQLQTDWQNLNGENEDVKFVTPGLF